MGIQTICQEEVGPNSRWRVAYGVLHSARMDHQRNYPTSQWKLPWDVLRASRVQRGIHSHLVDLLPGHRHLWSNGGHFLLLHVVLSPSCYRTDEEEQKVLLDKPTCLD